MTWTTADDTDSARDELLVLRCQLGEREAFDALIARWHPPLWTFVRRLTGDDDATRDAVQEVWLRVLRGIGRLREPARLRPWLFGIARHIVMDRLRDQFAARVEPDLDLAELPAAEDDDEAEAQDTLDRLRDELSRLPLIEREVLTLFYLQELTLAEVAALLEVPIGTVKSRLFRARQALRLLLQAKGVSS